MYDGKVIISTCFYKYDTISPYCSSLCQTCILLEKLGIKHDYWSLETTSHLEWGINRALTMFAESDATDIILIDSDESWTPESIIKLLLHKDPVVAGVYRKKNRWEEYVGVIKSDEGFHGKQVAEDYFLIEAERIPFGFTRIRKDVIIKFIETYPEYFIFGDGDKAYKFFWNEIRDNVFTGMDYCFSDKIKSLGYQLWIDPTLDIIHWGLTSFPGNYDKYLRGQKAIQDVKKMKEELDGKRSV